MKGSEFVFDHVDLLHYHPRLSYEDSLTWLRNEKEIINPKNNDDECFQYVLTLNYQNIKKSSQRISKIKHFINRYDWKELDFP